MIDELVGRAVADGASDLEAVISVLGSIRGIACLAEIAADAMAQGATPAEVEIVIRSELHGLVLDGIRYGLRERQDLI